jgi:hypothetical protein
MLRRRRIMTANDVGNWRELFDVALFESNRGNLRQRIERAKDAINTRIDALTKDQNENGGGISEYIALRDALITLADLYKIVYARKPGVSVSGKGGPAVQRSAIAIKGRISTTTLMKIEANGTRPTRSAISQ